MCSTDSTVLGTGAAARERSPVLGSSPAKSAFLQGVQSSANAATPRSPRIFSFHANSTITSPPTTPTRPAVSKDSSLTPNHSPPTERAPHSSPGKFLRSLKPLEVLEPDAELANFLKKHDTGFTRADVAITTSTLPPPSPPLSTPAHTATTLAPPPAPPSPPPPTLPPGSCPGVHSYKSPRRCGV